MGVVAFRRAQETAVAGEIIDALGIEAEQQVRQLAERIADQATRERLGRIADVIVERQGFSWYFPARHPADDYAER